MTSIEWLIDQLIPEDQHEGIMDIIEDAKEMHKQEIIDAYNKSFELRDKPYSTAEKYYQETFVSKGSD
jgi:vacuolar-type H+-ATPase subunit H